MEGHGAKVSSFKTFLSSLRATKETSWVLKFRKRRVSLVPRGSDRSVVTASPQNAAHPQVGLRKPSERLLIQHARGCCVIKLLFSTAISQHQTLAGLTAASGGRGNPAEEFNPRALSQSAGRVFFLKINLIHPLCPMTPLTQLKRSHITVPKQKKSYYDGESCPESNWH